MLRDSRGMRVSQLVVVVAVVDRPAAASRVVVVAVALVAVVAVGVVVSVVAATVVQSWPPRLAPRP